MNQACIACGTDLCTIQYIADLCSGAGEIVTKKMLGDYGIRFSFIGTHAAMTPNGFCLGKSVGATESYVMLKADAAGAGRTDIVAGDFAGSGNAHHSAWYFVAGHNDTGANLTSFRC